MSQIKEYIEFSENQHYVIKRITDVYGQSVNEYLHYIVFNAIITDLDNSDELGVKFCRLLKKTFEMEEKDQVKEGANEKYAEQRHRFIKSKSV